MRINKYLLLIVVSMINCAHSSPFFTSTSGSVLLDKATGLFWMRCSLGQTWDGRTCIGLAKSFTFDEARQVAVPLNEGDGYGGIKDWMVPTARQLSTLIQCNQGKTTKAIDIGDGGEPILHTCSEDAVNPSIDPIAMPETASYYWTASLYPLFEGSAYGIGFYNGSIDVNGVASTGAVRLVSLGKIKSHRGNLEFTNKIPPINNQYWVQLEKQRQAKILAEKKEKAAIEHKEKIEYEKEKQRTEEAERSAIQAALRRGPQQLYLLAGQSQRGKSIEIGGRNFGTIELYELIIEKFPTSEYAVKATDQLTAMDRSNKERSAVRDAANQAAETQRQAEQNAASRSQCFSQVRVCQAGCRRQTYMSQAFIQNCIAECERFCN